MGKNKKKSGKGGGNATQKSAGSGQSNNVKTETKTSQSTNPTMKKPNQEKESAVKDVPLENSVNVEENWENVEVEEVAKNFQYSKNKQATRESKLSRKEQENWDFGSNLVDDQKVASKNRNTVEDREIPSGSTTKIKDNRVTNNRNFLENYVNYEKEPKDDFDDFKNLLRGKKKFQYEKVKEIEADLFSMRNNISLAHCVAEDLNMGSGIATTFSSTFKRQGELANQRQKQGGMAVLDLKTRFIYYLVTKKYSNGKPTMETLWKSLKKMQKHVAENSVKEIAIPRIGCGLDRLEWSEVKPMIEHIFRDTDVKITVCNFQQSADTTEATSGSRIFKKSRIMNVSYPITEIERGTMIVYFGSEDGIVTSKIDELDRKFNMRSDYIRQRKKVGEVVDTNFQNWSYTLFGCIIKKTVNGPVDYDGVERCAKEINKINRKHGNDAYNYLGIEIFEDPPNEEMMFHKILNIFRCTVRNVDVYICYPKDKLFMMPPERISNDFF